MLPGGFVCSLLVKSGRTWIHSSMLLIFIMIDTIDSELVEILDDFNVSKRVSDSISIKIHCLFEFAVFSYIPPTELVRLRAIVCC